MSRPSCYVSGKRQIHLCLWTYFNDTRQQIPTGLNAILGNHNETSRTSSVEDASAGFFTRAPSTTEQLHQNELSSSTNTSSFTQVPRFSETYPTEETTSLSSTGTWGSSEVIRWTMVIQ